jgi:hypothetical protein
MGEGQLIRELKLGGVNHDKKRKWVKTMYMPEDTYHRDILLPFSLQLPCNHLGIKEEQEWWITSS